MNEESLAGLIDRLNMEFDMKCQQRHEMGAKKYGPVKFLEPGNDLTTMLLEELVDASNYARYFYVRLKVLTEINLMNQSQLADTPLGPTGVVNPFRKKD